MKCQVEQSTLTGSIAIPPSKSHTQRALLFALLAEGTSSIHHYLSSPDTDAMITAIQQLGAKVQRTKSSLTVRGVGSNRQFPNATIDAGNSGIIFRFIGALAALSPHKIVVTGDFSIQQRRPITPLLSALNQLGVSAESIETSGQAPIAIQGPLRGGRCFLNGEDSQPVSALLITTSLAPKSSEIYVTNPGEKPWVDLTLSWLDFLKIPYARRGYTHYTLPGKASIAPFTYTVPGDLSSLTFPVAAALITNSEISIANIDINDSQGDKKTLAIFSTMGGVLEYKGTTLHVKKGTALRGKTVDVNDIIDSLPILAVLGCFAEGRTILTNGAIARKKECDRIHSIATELRKMGARIEEREDGLIIQKSFLKGATVHAHGDHRIALALIVAALGARRKSVITDAQCTAKTYPQFAADLQKMGAKIE